MLYRSRYGRQPSASRNRLALQDFRIQLQEFLSVLSLLRRLWSRIDEVCKQVAAWTAWRNEHAKGVHWQFTIDNTRIKLDSVDPKFQFENE
ncbi:MAG: hypothetical protein FWC50_04355 [Planctomycetaceae bacterium]|nr:hypothetical protein [Planctomycetaceae bacterium]